MKHSISLLEEWRRILVNPLLMQTYRLLKRTAPVRPVEVDKTLSAVDVIFLSDSNTNPLFSMGNAPGTSTSRFSVTRYSALTEPKYLSFNKILGWTCW